MEFPFETSWLQRQSSNPHLLPAAPRPQAQRRHREQQHAHHAGGGGGSAMHPALGSTLRAVRILMRSPLFKKLTVTMMITGAVGCAHCVFREQAFAFRVAGLERFM